MRFPTWRWVAPAALVAAALVPWRWLPLRLPADVTHVVRAVLALAAGYILITGLERRMAAQAWGRDMGRAGLIRLLIRIALYVLVAVAILGALGVRLSQIGFGGAVLTVIVGLAGQTLFANVLAGMVLVIWRPFEIGDDISVMSSMMPVIASTRTHETLPSAHQVRVRDVNLLHTICVGEDGQLTLIPNLVMVQAIVRNHSHSTAHRVRVIAEAERDIDGTELWKGLDRLRRDLPSAGLPLQGQVAVHLLEVTATATAFVVETWVPSVHEQEEVRSAILVAVTQTLAELRARASAEAKPAGA